MPVGIKIRIHDLSLSEFFELVRNLDLDQRRTVDLLIHPSRLVLQCTRTQDPVIDRIAQQPCAAGFCDDFSFIHFKPMVPVKEYRIDLMLPGHSFQRLIAFGRLDDAQAETIDQENLSFADQLIPAKPACFIIVSRETRKPGDPDRQFNMLVTVRIPKFDIQGFRKYPFRVMLSDHT